jgi:hypothetical protein
VRNQKGIILAKKEQISPESYTRDIFLSESRFHSVFTLKETHKVITYHLHTFLNIYIFSFLKSLLKKNTEGSRRIQAAVGTKTTAAGCRRASTFVCSSYVQLVGFFFYHYLIQALCQAHHMLYVIYSLT